MVFQSLYVVLDTIFWPVLQLPPFWSILIITLAISFIITIIYKYTTDQTLMKQMKTELKELQTQMKTLKDHPEKMKQVQSEMMKINGKFMIESMKPTIYYMIPIILLFGWMGNVLAYNPITPNSEFEIQVNLEKNNTKNLSMELKIPENIGINLIKKEIEKEGEIFILKGKEGEYLLEFNVGNKTYKQNIIITNKKKYAQPLQTINDENVKFIKTELKETKPLSFLGNNFIGNLGWLGTYIILSIITGSLIRKIMKVY